MNRLLKLLPVLLIIFSGNISLHLDETLEVLLSGDGYDVSDLPAKAAGDWMVLHSPKGETSLNLLNVDVKAVQGCSDGPNESGNELSGRSVMVPKAIDPIMLVRGFSSLNQGAVSTAFLPAGSSSRQKK